MRGLAGAQRRSGRSGERVDDANLSLPVRYDSSRDGNEIMSNRPRGSATVTARHTTTSSRVLSSCSQACGAVQTCSHTFLSGRRNYTTPRDATDHDTTPVVWATATPSMRRRVFMIPSWGSRA